MIFLSDGSNQTFYFDDEMFPNSYHQLLTNLEPTFNWLNWRRLELIIPWILVSSQTRQSILILSQGRYIARFSRRNATLVKCSNNIRITKTRTWNPICLWIHFIHIIILWSVKTSRVALLAVRVRSSPTITSSVMSWPCSIIYANWVWEYSFMDGETSFPSKL